MYSVKKLQPKTELKRIQLSEGKFYVEKTQSSISYAVVDEAGNVVEEKNEYTGKMNYQMFPRKSTAQKIADAMNGKPVNFD